MKKVPIVDDEQVRRAGRVAYDSLTDRYVRTLLDVALAHVTHADA